MNLQGINASINKEPFNFVILQGGGGDSGPPPPPPVPLPLDPRMQDIGQVWVLSGCNQNDRFS